MASPRVTKRIATAVLVDQPDRPGGSDEAAEVPPARQDE